MLFETLRSDVLYFSGVLSVNSTLSFNPSGTSTVGSAPFTVLGCADLQGGSIEYSPDNLTQAGPVTVPLIRGFSCNGVDSVPVRIVGLPPCYSSSNERLVETASVILISFDLLNT